MHANRAVLPVALATVAQLAAQTPEWERVHELSAGQRISVVTHGKSFLEGRFQSWSPAAIEIQRGKRIQTLAASDVRSLDRLEKAPRWKGAAWGAILGFAVLFACGAASAGYVADSNDPRFGTRVEVGAAAGLFGAGLGAGIGALAGGVRSVPVYRAERRR